MTTPGLGMRWEQVLSNKGVYQCVASERMPLGCNISYGKVWVSETSGRHRTRIAVSNLGTLRRHSVGKPFDRWYCPSTVSPLVSRVELSWMR